MAPTPSQQLIRVANELIIYTRTHTHTLTHTHTHRIHTATFLFSLTAAFVSTPKWLHLFFLFLVHCGPTLPSFCFLFLPSFWSLFGSVVFFYFLAAHQVGSGRNEWIVFLFSWIIFFFALMADSLIDFTGFYLVLLVVSRDIPICNWVICTRMEFYFRFSFGFLLRLRMLPSFT